MLKLQSIGIFVIVAMALGAGVASGQGYPNRPIRIITSPPGGGADFLSRFTAHELTTSLGQRVIVDNRGTGIGIEIVSKAPPDGYTLLIQGNVLWTQPFLQKVPYDPVKDFSTIAVLVSSPSVLVVHPSVPVNSVKELIAFAKAKPGELNYGSGEIGSPAHLGAELFKLMAGVNIVLVNYKGTGQALTAVIGGESQLMFPTAGSVIPHIKSGRLKALAVTSAQPSELFPGLPTVAGSGVPGYEANTIYGLFAPAKTPGAIIKRLHEESVRFLKKTEVKEKLLGAGSEIVAGSPEQLAVTVKSNMATIGKVIKSAGIKVD